MKNTLHEIPIKPDPKNKGRAGVYMWINIVDLKVYVGSAANLLQRNREHLYNLRSNNNSCVYLQHAFNCYGEENFRFMVLDYITDEKGVLYEELTLDDLLGLEQCWMDKFKSYDSLYGYNIMPKAYNNLGFIFTLESRKKMSDSAKKRTDRKPHTLETRKNMSIIHTDKKMPPVSLVTRNKMSDSAKKRTDRKPHTLEARKKISIANIGREHLFETRVKIGISSKNRTHTLESRKKMSESRKKYWKIRHEREKGIIND